MSKGGTAATLLVDRAGVIRWWSPEAEALLGYPAAEAIGRSMAMLIVPEHHEGHWRGFGAAMASNLPDRPASVANIPLLCADGEVRAFPGRLIILPDAFGEPVGAAAIFSPVGTGGPDDGLFDAYREVVTRR